MNVESGKLDKEVKCFYTCECKSNCTNTIKAGDEFKVITICSHPLIISNDCYDRFVSELKEFANNL